MSKGIVFYCDGGANPNPGPSGSGVHGYIYSELGEKEKPTKSNSWYASDNGYVLLADITSGKATGVKIEKVIEIIDAIGTATNNVAEINAIIAAFENALTHEGISELHIICDSQYALTGMNEYLASWIRNNWILSTGQPVKNESLWRKISDLKTIVESRMSITSMRINGHEGDYGNTKADHLATIAVTRAWRNEISRETYEYDPNDYFKKREGVHPFISLNRFFFNTDAEFYQPGMYYQSDGSGKDFVTGKRSSESTFSVVCLLQEDPVIDAAIRSVHKRETDFNRVVYGKIDAIKNQEFLLFVENYGTDAFIPDRRNMNMNTPDKKPVISEVRADELPLRAFDSLTHLESILIEFQNNYLKNGVFFNNHETGVVRFAETTIHDVTSHFYDSVTKRSGKNEIQVYEFKKDFPVGCKDTRVKIPYEGVKSGELELILSFAEDIPPRNSFKHFELLEPSVYVVTWKDSDHLVRYATIVKTDEAVGIWANYYANNVLIKK